MVNLWMHGRVAVNTRLKRGGKCLFYYLLSTVLLILTAGEAIASSPFDPFIGQPAPEIVQSISRETTGLIEVQSFKFLSRTLPDGSQVLIYALLASPKTDGKYPAILVCHGGGASADQLRPSIEDWAKRGYVALCFDEPGIGGRGMKSDGPWDAKKWGVWGFRPEVSDNRLFDGVVAGLKAFALLKAQKNVDVGNIGITGGSWGGYLTTMLSGLLGDQVKAAFATYGGGFYDKGTIFMENLADLPEKEKNRWLDNMDAGAYVGGIRANFFGAYAANDWFFWPSSIMQTYDAITSPKNLVFSPNTSHVLNFLGGNVGATPVDQFVHRAMQEIDWMNWHLKKEGGPFPQCRVASAPARKGAFIEVEFQVEGPASIVTSKVWYSFGETPWRTRLWQEVEAKKSDESLYRASIPVEEVDQPINWFALVSDSRNISVSTPVSELLPTSLGFTVADRHAGYFAEDFETKSSQRRWRPYYENDQARKKGSYQLNGEAAHDGSTGLTLAGAITVDCFGLRGVALSQSAQGIRFWVKSTSSTGFDIELLDENATGGYQAWKNHQNNPGPEWKQIILRWEDFSPTFNSPPSPHFIPTKSLAKLRISTPDQAKLAFDSFETMTRNPSP